MTLRSPGLTVSPCAGHTTVSTTVKVVSATLLALVLLLGCRTAADALDEDRVVHLHVDVGHPAADDANRGTLEAPLATLGEGLSRAFRNRRDEGLSSHVFLHPGTYREAIDTVYPDAGDARIVIESVVPRQAIVSGSDIWTDWSCGSGVCTHDWPFVWGTAPNPWPDAVTIGPLARRSELVLIDGAILDQHLTREEMTPGSFYVDEAAGKLHVRPPAGVHLHDATVEVGVRGQLFRAQGLHHLEVRGVVFQHSASRFGAAAVDIVDQRDVILEDCEIRWNGQGVLSILGEDVVVRGCAIFENGGGGFTLLRSKNLLMEDVESSGNNWRGFRGDYTTWGVGHKISTTRGLRIRRLVSRDNLTRGLWLDTDVTDAVLEDLTIEGNLRDGIFIEAIQGPITIRDAVIRENGDAGVLIGTAASVTLHGNLIALNGGEQVRMSGNPERTFTSYFEGEPVSVRNEGWLVASNKIVAVDGSLLYGTTLPRDDWEVLMASSVFASNTYWHRDLVRPFRVGGGALVDIEDWRLVTRHDEDSTFSRGVAPPRLSQR
jgi:hypothetical protein